MSVRRSLVGALALAALASAGEARAQDAGGPGGPGAAAPFACKTIFVDTDGGARIEDLFAAVPALADLLSSSGLTRTTTADEADLHLHIGLAHVAPPTDDIGRLKSAETLTLRATLGPSSSPFEVASPVHTLAGIGHYGAVGAAGGWRMFGPAFVTGQLGPRVAAHLAGHGAGARILVDPPGARVAIGAGSAFAPPEGGLVVRCRAPDDPIQVTAKLDGYGPAEKTVAASVTDTEARVTLSALATPVTTTTSASSSSSSSSGGGPLVDAGIVAAIVAAAGGALWAIQLLKQRGIPLPPPAPPAPPRLTMLFFAANPRGTAQLALDEETREIRSRLNEGTYRDRIDFIPYWATRFDDVMQALNQHHPQIVHFSGHGTSDGALVLQGDDGVAVPLTPAVAQSLFSAFATGEDRVRLVMLNACFSAAQAEAIRTVVDVTIGSTRAITDTAAVDFAGAFYRAISFGRSVRDAFEQGQLGIAGNAAAAGMADDATRNLSGGATVQPASVVEILERPGVDAGTVVLVGDAPQTPGQMAA